MAEYTKILRTPQDVSDYLNYGAGSAGSPQWADSNNTVKIYIGNDIDMSQSEKFDITPGIITSIEGLDGNKYTISYLNMESNNNTYFAKTNSAKNIILKDITMKGNRVSPFFNAAITNVNVTGKIEGVHVGGICGWDITGSAPIKKSSFSGTLIGTQYCAGLGLTNNYTGQFLIQDSFASAIANNYFSAPMLFLLGGGGTSQSGTTITNSFFIGNVGKNTNITHCALTYSMDGWGSTVSSGIYAYILNPNVLNSLYSQQTISMISGRNNYLPSLNFIASVGDVPVGRRGQQNWNDFMVDEENINMAYLADLGWPI